MHKNIQLLAWFNFFKELRFYAAVGIIYFAHVTGSYALGLLVYSVSSLSSVLFEVPTGILSDSIGRKKTIILGGFFNLVAIVFFAIGHSFVVLAVGAIFYGLADSLFSGDNEALLYDSIQGDDKTQTYGEHSGRINSMSQFGPAVAALAGGFLAQWSFAYLLWLSVVPQLICFMLTLCIAEPAVRHSKTSGNVFHHLREALSRFKNNYKLRTLSLASIIEFGVGETMYKFTPAFIGSVWPLWAIGIARGLNNLCGAVGYRIAGKVMKRFTAMRAMLFGEVSGSVLCFVAVLFPSILSPILYAMTSISYGVNGVARDALMQVEFSDEQRATMGSLNSLFGNIFFAVFAFLIGLLADTLSAAHTLLIGEFLLLPIIYLYWKLFRNHRTIVLKAHVS